MKVATGALYVEAILVTRDSLTCSYKLFFRPRLGMHQYMLFRVIPFALLFCVIFLRPVEAQQISASPSSSTMVESKKPFDPTEATKAWLNTVPADKRAKSDAYFEGGYWQLLWNFLLGVAIAIFFLASRLSARLRDFAERMTEFKALRVAVYAVGYVLIAAVLSFPLTVYQLFYREHQYGFATQTFGPWFVEQLVGLVIALIAGTIALTVLYSVFRQAPRSWWIWGTLVVVVLSFIGNF